MLEVRRVHIYNISKIVSIAKILNCCGKDMAKKYDLHHWDNPFIKSLAIVCLGLMKNEVYLLLEMKRPVATFQCRSAGEQLHLEKLGTMPSESGRGIGSFCIKEVEKIAVEHGCKRVFFEVYALSLHAITFYERMGYEIVGKTETKQYKELVMEKLVS